MAYIKNIEIGKVLKLADEVSANKGQVVSKTIAQNAAVSMTLFAFSAGEEISTHESQGDAMVTVLEGTGRFTVDGTPHEVQTGETLIMPANTPHAVFAPTDFKMLLTVVFRFEED